MPSKRGQVRKALATAIGRFPTGPVLRPRAYQIEAAVESVQRLEKGGFVLRLPQGTGKSLISQLALRASLDASGVNRKALVIAPTVELRKQYARLGQWLRFGNRDSPARFVFELDESNAANRADFMRRVRSGHVLITTPKFLDHRLEYMKEFWSEIDLCILDEIDLWSIPIGDDEVRVHRHMELVLPALASFSIPILGLTGSSLTSETEALLRAHGCTGPVHQPPPASMTRFLPSSRLVLVPCRDDELITASEALTADIAKTLARLVKLLGLEGLPPAKIYSAVMVACRGSGDAAELAQLVRRLWNERTRLHEDQCELTGLRRSSGKQDAIKLLAAKHERVVIYAREIGLAVHLGTRILPGKVVAYAHAEDHRENIEGFQSGRVNVLAMTRDLGLRGLDFPNAEAMIIYSVTRSLTGMDQELCRIRSQRRHSPRKPIYLLCYSETYETSKLESVATALEDIRDGTHKRYVREVLSEQQRGARTPKVRR